MTKIKRMIVKMSDSNLDFLGSGKKLSNKQNYGFQSKIPLLVFIGI